MREGGGTYTLEIQIEGRGRQVNLEIHERGGRDLHLGNPDRREGEASKYGNSCERGKGLTPWKSRWERGEAKIVAIRQGWDCVDFFWNNPMLNMGSLFLHTVSSHQVIKFQYLLQNYCVFHQKLLK